MYAEYILSNSIFDPSFWISQKLYLHENNHYLKSTEAQFYYWNEACDVIYNMNYLKTPVMMWRKKKPEF